MLTSRQGAQLLDGYDGICHCIGDDDPLAGSKSVGFHHPRQLGFFDERNCVLAPLKKAKGSRGHIDPLHDLFGKCLAAFEAGCLLARAKHGVAELAQRVGPPGCQRSFGANHDEIYGVTG